MAIIAISGKKSSGKNLVASIIQYLTCDKGLNVCTYQEWMNYNSGQTSTPWQQKQFADKLKDIVCLLIGCNREYLENEDFKNKELGENWNKEYYKIAQDKTIYDETEPSVKLIQKLTPRLLLQQIGTDLFRNLIHPDIWVTSLFNEYKPIGIEQVLSDTIIRSLSDRKDDKYLIPACKSMYPAWIITDMRFKNELKAVKDRDGITIRVNRYTDKQKLLFLKSRRTSSDYVTQQVLKEAVNFNTHISETELDNETFDHVIDNNGTIKELIEKVKQILILEKLL